MLKIVIGILKNDIEEHNKTNNRTNELQIGQSKDRHQTGMQLFSPTLYFGNFCYKNKNYLNRLSTCKSKISVN